MSNDAAGSAPPREDWNRRIEKQKVLAAFGRRRFPWLDLPALIERSLDVALIDAEDPCAALARYDAERRR